MTTQYPVANGIHNDHNNDQYSLQIPSHNFDAEVALLGAAMLNIDALNTLASLVSPVDFFNPSNGSIAQALISINSRNERADVVTVVEELKRFGFVPNPSRLLDMVANCPSFNNAELYARRILDSSAMRKLKQTAREIDLIANSALSANEALAATSNLMNSLNNEESEELESNIEKADIADLLLRGIHRPVPDVLKKSDETCIFYSGKVNCIYGEASSGKSWVALAATFERLQGGGHVLYLDYEENNAMTQLSRLLALGVDRETLKTNFHWWKPLSSIGTREMAELTEIIQENDIELVIFDTFSAAWMFEEGSDNDNSLVTRWIRRLTMKLAALGPCVILIDHVVKSVENRGFYASGAHAKKDIPDGTVLMMSQVEGWTPTKSGYATLVICKDRHGGVGAIGETTGIISFQPSNQGEKISFHLKPSEFKKLESQLLQSDINDIKMDICKEMVKPQWKNKVELSMLKDILGVEHERVRVLQAIQEMRRDGLISAEKNVLTLVRPWDPSEVNEQTSMELDELAKWRALKQGGNENVDDSTSLDGD